MTEDYVGKMNIIVDDKCEKCSLTIFEISSDFPKISISIFYDISTFLSE